MISKLYIENFRSIRKAELPLGKITVLTGANNSGKSSVLYALMVLRDFVFNPNQSLEQLFALPFINLGGFEEVVFKNKVDDSMPDFIKIGIETIDEKHKGNDRQDYQIILSKSKTYLNGWSEGAFQHRASMEIGLPYQANIQKSFTGKNLQGEEFVFKWDGIVARTTEIDYKLSNWLNAPVTHLTDADFVPIIRGFSKPYYTLVPMSGVVNSEEEIATLLRTDDSNRANTLGALNLYLEEIAGKNLIIESNGIPGLFSLKVKNTTNGQQNLLVNEGTGVNQLVTILAKTFQYGKSFICIDEPEIHLHPSMVRKLAIAFTEIANEFNTQFLISTHSEHFVQALMKNVADGMSPNDIKVYYLQRQDSETMIEEQPINEKGQIAGGLSHFYESELADLKSFFKLVD